MFSKYSTAVFEFPMSFLVADEYFIHKRHGFSHATQAMLDLRVILDPLPGTSECFKHTSSADSPLDNTNSTDIYYVPGMYHSTQDIYQQASSEAMSREAANQWSIIRLSGGILCSANLILPSPFL